MITASIRPSPRRWSMLTTGFAKKVSKRPNATGMNTVWAQYNAAMIKARTGEQLKQRHRGSRSGHAHFPPFRSGRGEGTRTMAWPVFRCRPSRSCMVRLFRVPTSATENHSPCDTPRTREILGWSHH
jgi:hypothetical protein